MADHSEDSEAHAAGGNPEPSTAGLTWVEARLRLLSELGSEFVAATSDVQRLLNLVSRRLAEVVGDSCGIHLIGDDGKTFSRHTYYAPDPELAAAGEAVTAGARFRVGEGQGGMVAATGIPLLIPVTSPLEMAAKVKPEVRPLIERMNVHSFMCLPLLVDGRAIGIMTMARNRPGHSFTAEDLRLATDCASHASLALTIARSREAERVARVRTQEALAALHRSQAELRISEERYRRIIEITAQGVWVTDAEGRTTFVNRRMAEMLGYHPYEMMGMAAFEFIFAEDRAAAQVRMADRRAGIGAELEARLKRKDGGELWIASTTTPVLGEAGDYQGSVSMMTDASERRSLQRAEEQLRQAQKMEAVGRLAAGIAHDFNNILSVILSYGELVQSETATSDPRHTDIGEIVLAARRAADLTRQLLMFSRQQVIEPRLLDLNEVSLHLDGILRRIVGEDIDLVTLPGKGLGKVLADPSSVEQVLMNLVVNARDAMPRGGRLTIETANVTLDEDYARTHVGTVAGPHVALIVTDTGTGMDGATLARIFEPFFTTKGVGKGTGLGLSTVFGIAQQWGGSVWVYSELGKGTTFKVYLPRAQGLLVETLSPAPPVHRRGTETVLLVEDQEQVRAVALNILKKHGYQVIAAESSQEALRLASEHDGPIHLLLTDVVMPQMSGAELSKHLSVLRPDIKTLCMSGYTDDSIVRHGVLESEMAFLQKPFTPLSLGFKVREVLDGGRK